MSNSFATESEGRTQVSRGSEFESAVQERLGRLFAQVETHKRIEGFSGIRWRVDFLVDSKLVVEASVQRRLETKINSTFLRFVDIVRNHPSWRATLIVDGLHVGFHKGLGKKYFPTSEYRTMMAFGFPVLTLADLAKLLEYEKGSVSALEVSSRPLGFNPRSILPDRSRAGPMILQLLAKTPMPRREIAKAIGRSPTFVDDAMKLLPQVKKVRAYYGLSEEAIYKRLAAKGDNHGIQGRLVRDWLRGRLLEMIDEKRICRTSEFAERYGLNPNSLTHLVHQLNHEGVIRRIRKAVWARSRS